MLGLTLNNKTNYIEQQWINSFCEIAYIFIIMVQEITHNDRRKVCILTTQVDIEIIIKAPISLVMT